MSSNRYSALNRRPAASSSLFQDYPGNNNTSRPSSSTSHTRPSYAYPSNSPRPASPYSNSKPNASPYSYQPPTSSNGKLTPPLSTSSPSHDPFGPSPNSSHYHAASPNSKGQYSTSVLEELESQNDNTQTSILSQKVSQLKTLTIAIGDEIRDSSQLAGQINDSFENTGAKLKGTMNRMLRMAKKTGIGWKIYIMRCRQIDLKNGEMVKQEKVMVSSWHEKINICATYPQLHEHNRGDVYQHRQRVNCSVKQPAETTN